jgi:large subunit ribosomal protein L4
MASLEIKSKEGKKVGTHELSEAISSVKAPAHLLHRAVVAEEANKRQGTQSARTRSEAKGGGRKPYKQKKTGNARQGTNRAPQFAHGGMALAVKPRDYEKKVNRKERRFALMGALNERIEAGAVIIADSIVFSVAKTRDAVALLKGFELHNTRRVLVILPQYDEVTFKSFRNIPNVEVRTAPTAEAGVKTAVFSTRDLLVAHKVLIAKDALAKIEEVWAK